MNILFIVPYVPNQIRVRPYNLIRFLARRDHRVTLVTLWTDEQEKQGLEELRRECQAVYALPMPAWRSMWNCVAALPSGRPLQAAYSWNTELAHQASRMAVGENGKGTFDVIHVEHLRGVQYGLYLKNQLADASRSVPVIWDSVDSISLLFRQAMVESKSFFSRSLTRFELGRTERYEGWLLDRFDQVLVTSPADRKALTDLAPTAGQLPRVTVLRNGVDLGYFTPGDKASREPASIVISGKMSYHANVAMALNFIQQIMPLVWKQHPEVKVSIVGKDPAPQVQALGVDSRVEVTGTVSDIRPHLCSASLAAAPIAYGAGIQNKVLEAMACGTPVVASSQAISALEIVPGQEVCVADTPVEFASAILNLLNDAPLRERLGDAGRSYVERNHDWYGVAGQLELVYDQAIQGKRLAEKAH